MSASASHLSVPTSPILLPPVAALAVHLPLHPTSSSVKIVPSPSLHLLVIVRISPSSTSTTVPGVEKYLDYFR